jgi:photosystem II stability/assembly factor-like uncharacterized protein
MTIKRSSFLSGVASLALLAAIPFTTPSAFANPEDASLYSGMKARNIGPASMSGRVSAIDVVASNPNHIYVAAASGGVWKSTDAGTTWKPIFDDQDVASIGSITINQSNPDIIWVGTGEGNVRNSVSIGNGVYKSLDGGKTWKNMGLKDSEHINRITLDPTNPNVAYVAAMGHLWSDGGERGVYKTTDGGTTWQLILAGENATSGATDIKMDPQNPNNLYASMWQFRRYPDYFESGGPGSGLHVSHDGGETWRELTVEDGLPTEDLGRSNFSISASDPNTVYALIEAQKSAIIRSDDGGHTWRKVNQDKNIAIRPFYYMDIEVDPNDKETIYNVESRLSVSNNGGKNFDPITSINCCSNPRGLHIDLHDLWINPTNSNHMIVANDGGIGISRDKGTTWRFVANLPLGQWYHINVDNETPYNVYGGLQDNGSFRGPAYVLETGGIQNLHFQEIGFGDGFEASPDPDDSTKGYEQSQGGSLGRWDMNTGESRNIRPNPPKPGDDLRFNWNSGFAQDPFDTSTIYYGSQFLHKSTDKGNSWTAISSDLTTNDPTTQRSRKSGGITSDVTAAENYQSIVAIAPSPLQKDLIWVGTDDGRLHITQDGGESWSEIGKRVRGINQGAWIPHIEVSPHDPSVAFVIYDDHRRGDMRPHAYRVENFGKKWTRIITNDVKGYALTIQQDHVDPNLLFMGTEFGLFVSTNAGKKWMKWTAGVPTVSVMDLAIQERENDLALGTHGRAVFILDDYSGLRGLKDADFKERLKLLSVTDGIQYERKQTPGPRFLASTAFIGENREFGSMITFIASGDDLTHPDAKQEKARKIKMRADAAKSKDKKKSSKPIKVKVEVSDANGKIVRTFTRDVYQGINRLTWNTNTDGWDSLQPSHPGQDRNSGFGALPGDYALTITLGDAKVTGNVTVKADPRLPYTLDDAKVRLAFLKTITDMNDVAVKAVKQIRMAKKDANTIKALANNAAASATEDDAKALKGLAKQAGKVAASMTKLEDVFNVSRQGAGNGIVYTGDRIMSIIRNALSHASSYKGKPGPASKAMKVEADNALAKGLNKTNAAFSGEVADLKTKFGNSGLSLLSTSTVEMPND